MDRYTDLTQRRDDIDAQIKQAHTLDGLARALQLAELYPRLAENALDVEKLAIGHLELPPVFLRVLVDARHYATDQAGYWQRWAASCARAAS